MSIAEIGDELATRASGEPGYRVLIVGEDGLDIASEAAGIARRIASAGRRVILVEWARAGASIASEFGLPEQPGFWNAILEGAPLQDVAHAADAATLDIMPAGIDHAPTDIPKEVEAVHSVLDTLDRSYDHVLLLADRVGAQKLFASLEGRIDAGVVIAAEGAAEGERTFLGFAVPELEVLRHAPTAALRGPRRKPGPPRQPSTH